MMKKRNKSINLVTWLIPKLRKFSVYWPPRSRALLKARVIIDNGFYKNGNPKKKTLYRCEKCQDLFEREDIQMDHTIPVVDLEGFQNWDEYINSLFCDESNYSTLCKKCHSIKTTQENQTRIIKRLTKTIK